MAHNELPVDVPPIVNDDVAHYELPVDVPPIVDYDVRPVVMPPIINFTVFNNLSWVFSG